MKKLPSLVELAYEYLLTEFSERADKTVENHSFYLNAFIEFVGNRKINPANYQDWTKHCFAHWSPQTAKCLALAASSRFLNWMERSGHIERSPHHVTKAPLVKAPPVREPFTGDEFEKLKQAASTDPVMLWAIVCGWETGMAIGDVSLLCWINVDFFHNAILTNRLKTNERCIIPFREHGEMSAMLEDKFTHQDPDAWPNNPTDGIVYVDPELAALYKRGAGAVQTRFANIRNRAGITPAKSFHNLRASFCSRLANAGIQLSLACQMSGHKNPAIFSRYVTANIENLHEQSAIAWAKQA